MPDATGVPHTCPLIDGAIDYLEQTREANSELRQHAVEALDRVDDLESQVADLETERDDLQTQVDDLRTEVDSKDEKLYELEQTLESLGAPV